jgi:hypothetical protein
MKIDASHAAIGGFFALVTALLLSTATPAHTPHSHQIAKKTPNVAQVFVPNADASTFNKSHEKGGDTR